MVPGPRGELTGAGESPGRGVEAGLDVPGRGVNGAGLLTPGLAGPGVTPLGGGTVGRGGVTTGLPPKLGGGAGGQPWAKASAVALRARITASASLFMCEIYPSEKRGSQEDHEASAPCGPAHLAPTSKRRMQFPSHGLTPTQRGPGVGNRLLTGADSHRKKSAAACPVVANGRASAPCPIRISPCGRSLAHRPSGA